MRRIPGGMVIAMVGVALVAFAAGCSGSPSRDVDAAVPDAAVDAPLPDASCEQQQREYVNQRLGPVQESDVAQVVGVVLGTADFSNVMPYCSGPRPTRR